MVAEELHVCPICGTEHAVGVLLHKRMKEIENQVTGTSICSEHRKILDSGMIAFVVIDPSKSEIRDAEHVTPQDAYRTGQYLFMKKDPAKTLFNRDMNQEFMYIEEKVYDYILEITQQNSTTH